MSSRKVMIIRLISIQNRIFIGKEKKFKLELSNYATKSKVKKQRC